MIFVRLAAPVTSVTSRRRTPKAAATAVSVAAVAFPSTARALTRTTSAPSCSPPTPGRADPGRTRIIIRTLPVCPATGVRSVYLAGAGSTRRSCRTVRAAWEVASLSHRSKDRDRGQDLHAPAVHLRAEGPFLRPDGS